MNREPEVHLRTGSWVLLFANLMLGACQTGFGKQAALSQGRMGLATIATNPWYVAALGALALQTLVWTAVLKRTPLGFAYGFGALQYVNTLLISRYAFGEHVSIANIAGAALIITGVICWARGQSEES